MKNQDASARIEPLSLVDMSSAFVLLGLGLSLAVLVFLIELTYKRIKDHYFKNKGTNEIKAPTTVIRAPVIVHPTTRPLPLAPITVQPVQPVTVVRKTQTRSLPARKTVKPFHPTAPVVKKTKPVPAATVLEGKAQIIAVATAFAADKKKEKQLIKVPIIQPMIVPPPPALPGTVNED